MGKTATAVASATADTQVAADETRAEWSTAFVNDLPDSSFAFVEKGGKKDDDGKTTPRNLRHLPIRDANGKADEAHVRNALSRLPQTELPASALKSAKRKVLAAAKEAGVEASDNETRAIDVAIVLADGELLRLVQQRATEATAADVAASQAASAPEGATVGDQTRSATYADNPNTIVDSVVQAVAWAPISRVDVEKREVEGVLTDEQVDTFGTIFDYDDMKRVVQDAWHGNLREQHNREKAVGRKVDVTFDDAGRRIILRTRISKGAEDTWQKILDGTLTGYSIGAANCKVKERRMVAGRSLPVPVLTPESLPEVSVVDAPSNPGASASGLTIYRSADGLTAEADAALDDLNDSTCCHAGMECRAECSCGDDCACKAEHRATVGKPSPEEANDTGTDLEPAAKASSGSATDTHTDRDGDDVGEPHAYDDPADGDVDDAGLGDGDDDDEEADPPIAEAPAQDGGEFETHTAVESHPGETADTVGTMDAPGKGETRAAKSASGGKSDGDADDDEEAEEGDDDEGAGDAADEERAEAASAGKGEIDYAARDKAISDAEESIAKPSGHAHDTHEHPHASGYDVVHFHDHAHEHQDGTKHAHPHMHAHEHGDHYGDPMHSHPHNHVHDHSHEYRMWAPDVSRVLEADHTREVPGAAVEAEQAPASAPVQRADGATLVGVTTRADDTAAPVVETHTHADGTTHSDAPAAVETRAATEADAVETPEADAVEAVEERAGKRVSGATRDKLHKSIASALDACDCATCRDAASLYVDGVDDGEGGEEAAETRVQQSDAHAQRMQRVQVARMAREVVAEELRAALAPLMQQFRAVAARLAAVESGNSVEERAQAAFGGKFDEALALMRQIAEQPQPGGPVLQGSTAVQKVLPTDRNAVNDASTFRMAGSYGAGASPADVAGAVQTLMAAGMLNPQALPQQAQIAGAQAIIAQSMGAGRP